MNATKTRAVTSGTTQSGRGLSGIARAIDGFLIRDANTPGRAALAVSICAALRWCIIPASAAPSSNGGRQRGWMASRDRARPRRYAGSLNCNGGRRHSYDAYRSAGNLADAT